MNLYKKFTNYILENHPLIWHSKVIQLSFSGIILWIISYFIGFQTVDLSILNKERIDNLYFEYLYIFFHIIIVISILTIWAIYFFKNNAFKNYYPLERGYFTKLFFYLFFPFLFLISAYYPYTLGAKNKAATFFNENELKNDINKINLGFAFLINSTDDYNLINRVYPNPYPLERQKFNYSTNKWDKTYKDIHESKKRGGKITEYKPENYPEYNTNVEGTKCQFYKMHSEFTSYSKCNSQKIVYQLVKENQLDNPVENSILNFSRILVSPKMNDSEDSEIYDYEADIDETLNTVYIANYAPTVYEWVKSKRYSAIQNSIEEFKIVCNKYNINHTINPKHIVQFLKYKNFKNFRKSITKSYEDNYSYYNMEDEMNQIESVLKRKNETIKFMASQHVYFFDEDGLHSLFSNLKNVNNNRFFFESIIAILFITLGITWLFICFEFTSIKSFIISVPIAGVIAIINSLIITFSNYGFFGDHLLSFIVSTFLVTFFIIIGLTLLALKTKFLKKKLLNILMNLSYFIAPVLFILMFIIYNQSTKYVQFMDKCSGMTRFRIEESILMNPFILFLGSLSGILLYFTLLKKWKAYEE